MIKKIFLKFLIRFLKVPEVKGDVDKEKEQKMFWGIYPTREFRNYISRRDLQILQILGEGVSREEYLIYLGQRIELGLLLRNAKQSFETVEKKRKTK